MLLLATGLFHWQFFSMGTALGPHFLTVLLRVRRSRSASRERHRAADLVSGVRMLRWHPAGSSIALARCSTHWPFLPPWMQSVSRALPPSYVLRGNAGICLADPPFPVDAALLVRCWPGSNYCFRVCFSGRVLICTPCRRALVPKPRPRTTHKQRGKSDGPICDLKPPKHDPSPGHRRGVNHSLLSRLTVDSLQLNLYGHPGFADR